MSKLLHIVLVPPEGLLTECIELSQKMGGKFDVHFVLNRESALPHLTLSQLRLHPGNQDKVIAAVSEILQGTKKVPTGIVDVSSYMGWVWLCTLWGDVSDLHKRVASCSSLAESTTAEPYLPHITITRLRESTHELERKAESALMLSCQLPQEIVFEKAMIGIAGEHGVFEKKLLEFDLA